MDNCILTFEGGYKFNEGKIENKEIDAITHLFLSWVY